MDKQAKAIAAKDGRTGMTTIWSRVSRLRPAVGLAVSAVLISGMAAASLAGAGAPRA